MGETVLHGHLCDAIASWHAGQLEDAEQSFRAAGWRHAYMITFVPGWGPVDHLGTALVEDLAERGLAWHSTKGAAQSVVRRTIAEYRRRKWFSQREFPGRIDVVRIF